jgi:hypothetical protein
LNTIPNKSYTSSRLLVVAIAKHFCGFFCFELLDLATVKQHNPNIILDVVVILKHCNPQCPFLPGTDKPAA